MSELRSLSYWVGHLMVIVATVLGVYLAATAGFNQALKLDLLQSDRGTYYVAESLYQELKFNNANMEGYVERTKDKNSVFKEHIAGIRLNEFIFNTAQESESTFEIEPKLLSEVSNYYFSTGSAIDTYYQNGMASPASVMVVVKRETEKLKTQGTLERLASYNKKLAEDLIDRGMPITLSEN